MMVEQDGFGAFVDEDDDDEYALIMPEVECLRYQVGNLTIPDWLMQGISHQHILFRNDACDVLVRGRYIRAHKGNYILRIGTSYSIQHMSEIQ
jgi:hypothetical protein